MIEFAVALVVQQRVNGIKISPRIEEVDTKRLSSQKEHPLQMKNRTGDDLLKDVGPNKARTSFFDSFSLNKKIDFVAFFIFIFGFSVFNIIYWKQVMQDFVI